MSDDRIAGKVERHETMLVWVMGVAITLLLVAAALYFWHFGGRFSDEQDVWGQFGDYMGGVLNPIFGSFALFALLYTIVLQVRELSETREELQRTTEASRQNTFENTFFQLLRLHHQILEGTRFTDWRLGLPMQNPLPETHQGRDALFVLASRWGKDLDFPNRVLPSVTNKAAMRNEERRLDEEWSAFLRDEYGSLGHYFRNLYTVIKYVDESEQTKKKHYVNIVRAQLSGHEFYLLFYNCFKARHAPFKKLIEDYEFFEHIYSGGDAAESPLLIPAQHYALYKKEAYGDNVPPIFNLIETD